jgi:hypothetical protein
MALDPAVASAVWGEGVGSGAACLCALGAGLPGVGTRRGPHMGARRGQPWPARRGLPLALGAASPGRSARAPTGRARRGLLWRSARAPTRRARRGSTRAQARDGLARGCWPTAIAAGSFMLPGGGQNIFWARAGQTAIEARPLAAGGGWVAGAVRVWQTQTAPIYNGLCCLCWAAWAGQLCWAGVQAFGPLSGSPGRSPGLLSEA